MKRAGLDGVRRSAARRRDRIRASNPLAESRTRSPRARSTGAALDERIAHARAMAHTLASGAAAAALAVSGRPSGEALGARALSSIRTRDRRGVGRTDPRRAIARGRLG